MSTTRREFLRHAGLLAAASTAGLASLRCAPGAPRPDTLGELERYDGVGLAELIRSGELTAAEVLEDTLRRIAQVNPSLNAVLPGLLDASKARFRASGPLGEGRLSGVSVLLKNLIEYEAAAIDAGSRLYAKARELGTQEGAGTSPLVAAMERSGMIVAGITNTPEMGLIDTTEPVLHGPTHNPWNPAYTPGGSSGGSGAAVAARLVPLAHGNDGGGSIRLPASQCGVFGLKPTRARELGSGGDAGYDGPLNIASDLCLSISVRDTAAFLDTVERKDNPDLPPVGYVAGPSGRRLRIALSLTGFQGQQPASEVRTAIEQTASLLEDLGHEVTEAEPPIDGEEFVDTFIHFWASGAAQTVAQVPELAGPEAKPDDLLEPWTLGLAEMAMRRGPDLCVAKALEVFPRVASQLATFFETHDVLLTPVLREPPYELGWHAPTGDFETVYARVLDDVCYTPLQNAAGLPAMSVPLYWTDAGLPVGSHFSTSRGGERTLLELAYELEAARPWAERRPPISA